jgi:hypothetical protein
MPYLYPKERQKKEKFNLNRIPFPPSDEQLTGFIGTEPASDLEERYGRSLDKLGKQFQFQYEVYTANTLPGEQKVVDFVVSDGEIPYPEEVDAAFTHKTAEQKSYDTVRDAIVNDVLSKEGFQPVKRIDGERMNTQEGADQVASELHG